MAISNKRTPNVGDLNRGIKKIYDDINDVINSVNQEVLMAKESDGKAGDIRVVKDSSSKINTTKHKLQFRSDEGWDKVITMPRNPDKNAMIAYNTESETFEWVNVDDALDISMSSPGKATLSSTSNALSKYRQAYSVMGEGNNYANGLLLAGSETHNSHFLRKDGQWAPIPSASFPTGDSGNAAIYDNSGVPTLKDGITQAEMQTAIGGVYTDTNTQNTTTLSFVDSSNDIILRNTTTGASSGTDDIKFVAGANITLTNADADNMTIAAANDNTNQLTTFNIGVDTNTNATTIAHGETLTLTGGTGISTETTADGTVTLTNTVTNTDVNVSVGNLETRLGEIDTSITIGNANTINTTIAGNLTIGHDTITMSDDGNSKPLIEMTNTGNNSKPCMFTMTKDRITGIGTNNLDNIGQFDFKGFDADGNSTIYSSQVHKANSIAAGAERGKYQHTINSNGFLRNAISHTSGNGVVDTVIGYGLNSNTDIAGNISAAGKFYLNDGYSTWIEGDDENISFYGDSSILGFFHGDEIKLESLLRLKEKASSGTVPTAYGQVWVKNDTPNNLYFTNDAGNDVQITNGSSLAGSGGGSSTQYWDQMIGGYRINLTSTTLFYTIYRVWNENWSNSDFSPTSVTSTDAYSAFMIAPRAGSITNIKIQGRTSDIGATDPFKFYFYKMGLSNGETTKTATAMMTTSTITPPTANRTWSHTEDFSSNNTFSEDDNLFVWIKKDSNSGNQDLYFNLCINGEYT